MDGNVSREQLHTVSPREQFWHQYGTQLTKDGIASNGEAQEASLGLYRGALNTFVSRVPQIQGNAITFITGSALDGLNSVGICPPSTTFEEVSQWNHAKGASKHRAAAIWSSEPDPEAVREENKFNKWLEKTLAGHHLPSDIDVVVMEEGTQRVQNSETLYQLAEEIFREYGVYVEIHPSLATKRVRELKRIGEEFDVATLHLRETTTRLMPFE